jgi:hypothetical protein
MSEEIEDLKRRITELEADLKRLLKAQEPKTPLKPRQPYVPRDWTAGMRMPPDAAQAMARVVPDVKREPQTAQQVQDAWAKTRISGPSGFGPPKWEEEKKPQPQKPEEPQKPKDNRSPQTRIFDAMVDYWAGGANDTSKLR